MQLPLNQTLSQMQTQWKSILDPIIANSGSPAAADTLTGTTLAKNVVNSSLTSVGTITTGVWNGTPITAQYLVLGIGLVAQIYFSGVNAVWSTTGSTLAAFTAGTSQSPTLEFSGSFGIPQVTATTFPEVTINSLPAGTYQVLVTGTVTQNSVANAATIAVNDGTSTSGNSVFNVGTGVDNMFTCQAMFQYSSVANRTFQLFGRIGGGHQLNVDVTGGDATGRLDFFINKVA